MVRGFVIVLGLVLVFNPTILVLLFLACGSFVVASFGGLTIGASGAELEIDNVGAKLEIDNAGAELEMQLEIDKDGVELNYVEDVFPFGLYLFPFSNMTDGGALSAGGVLVGLLPFLDILGGGAVSGGGGGGALLLGGGGALFARWWWTDVEKRQMVQISKIHPFRYFFRPIADTK
ncbi:hypothetical protein IFM89_035635 [Coptis chinensis]|uniref:Uncharacterized protein n=1 Tax=Coptis chinensis TaxID=261450 RepID=A0A835HG96_9MAGN|nr:hypothetical protein IFM89_035635 [Coptis chinensis]